MTDRFNPDAYDYYVTHPPEGSTVLRETMIEPGIREAENEFGMAFQSLPWGESLTDTGRIPYVLAGPVTIRKDGWSFVNGLAEGTSSGDYLRALGGTTGIKLNVVSAYEAMGDRYSPLLLAKLLNDGAQAWRLDIPALDRAIGANTIYPDSVVENAVTVSPEDIADNIRCETFRLAYNDFRDESPEAREALGGARQEASATIAGVAAKIRQRHLWHRAPTDGAIFVKTTEGWLVSQTSSNKSTITPERFSLIQSFDPETNTIVSVGENPPSSDSPEFLVALGAMDDVGLAVHFHSNGLTRKSNDPYTVRHRTPDLVRYGRFSSAPAVIDALAETGDGWIILKEHGVLWTGDDSAEFSTFIGSLPIKRAHNMGLVQGLDSQIKL